jgi:SPX domain protein involved in polyphosphate accumulation
MLQRRYELKFPLGMAAKAALLERGAHALRADPHGIEAVYRVSSQYFDTPDYSCYREKLDGERARRKFRLRYYTVRPSDEPPVRDAFFEIKHRVNNTVYKERVRLTDEGASAILADASLLLRLEELVAQGEQEKMATIEDVKRAAARPGFHAVHVISYMREAWEGSVDSRLRLTFDTACRALPPAAFLDVGGMAGAAILSPHQAIAEVKFDHAVPRWVRDIVFELGLKVSRFSKYARGVEVLGLTGDPRGSNSPGRSADETIASRSQAS